MVRKKRPGCSQPPTTWPIPPRISRNSFRNKVVFNNFQFLEISREIKCAKTSMKNKYYPFYDRTSWFCTESELRIAVSDDEATHPESDGSTNVTPQRISQAFRTLRLPSRRHNHRMMGPSRTHRLRRSARKPRGYCKE